MGKNSDYIKEKDKKLLLKLYEFTKQLPLYTKDFLNEKADANANTAFAYACDLMTFFEYLQEFSPGLKDVPVTEIPIERLEQLTFQDINEYQNYLDVKHPEVSGTKEHELAKAGLARKMSTLRGFYQYMCAHDFISFDPTRGATRQHVKLDDHVITRLNLDEVREYLHVIQTSSVKSDYQRKRLGHTRLRDYAILYLLLNTGIRVSECVALDLDDLNFHENSLVVVRKGKKEQRLYYDDELQMVLLDYIENERPNYTTSDDEKALFLSIQKKRMSVRSIQLMVKKFAEEIGTNKHITPHKMRSTYGTALYNKTGDIRLVADVLGHSSVNTTVKHYAAMEEERRKQAGKINPYEDESMEQ